MAIHHTRIKICGITSTEDAITAESAGCDAIGLVFWPKSQRFVSVRRAREIVESLSPLVTTVGVFVDPDVEIVTRTARSTGIAAAQLCGTLTDGPWAKLSRSIRLIRALRLGEGTISEREKRASWNDYLCDNATTDQPGGGGVPFDWSRMESVRDWGRLWLAGGLHPDNVGEAIRCVRPYAVDVSTGVEKSPGVKSEALVCSFIQAVRTEDAEFAV